MYIIIWRGKYQSKHPIDSEDADAAEPVFCDTRLRNDISYIY